MIKVNGQLLDIAVFDELEPYLDRFDNYAIREDKLQSCSPFRNDAHPSFAVNLENGSWIDSGAVDSYSKGHFVSLLSFLREESFEDTAEYLLSIYSLERKEVDTLQLDMGFLSQSSEPEFLSEEVLRQYAYRSPYLGSRGISEEVQQIFRIGYDPKNKAVAMPWVDGTGNIVNIKFRSVTDKRFWYSGGQPLKQHLYGFKQLLEKDIRSVCIVESEIDCLRLWTQGIPAVALGTAHISKQQVNLLMNSQVEEIIIATDNDVAGKKCRDQLHDKFIGNMSVKDFAFPIQKSVKDISDLSDDLITEGLENASLILSVILN